MLDSAIAPLRNCTRSWQGGCCQKPTTQHQGEMRATLTEQHTSATSPNDTCRSPQTWMNSSSHRNYRRVTDSPFGKLTLRPIPLVPSRHQATPRSLITLNGTCFLLFRCQICKTLVSTSSYFRCTSSSPFHHSHPFQVDAIVLVVKINLASRETLFCFTQFVFCQFSFLLILHGF